MKQFGRIRCFLLFVILTLLLSSCSFVTYHRYGDAEAQKALEEAKAEALQTIQSLSDIEYYNEENRLLYEISLQDAINEINECQTLDEIKDVLFRHTHTIEAIPTSLALVREEVLKKLEEHL